HRCNPTPSRYASDLAPDPSSLGASRPVSRRASAVSNGAMPTALFEPGAPDVLYLIDLSSYVLRAYHAIAPLSSPSGEPTQAVHGTVNVLERVFRERKPQLGGVAMDAGRTTFRQDIYPEYK